MNISTFHNALYMWFISTLQIYGSATCRAAGIKLIKNRTTSKRPNVCRYMLPCPYYSWYRWIGEIKKKHYYARYNKSSNGGVHRLYQVVLDSQHCLWFHIRYTTRTQARPSLHRFSRNSHKFCRIMCRHHDTEFHENQTLNSSSMDTNSFIPLSKVRISLS